VLAEQPILWRCSLEELSLATTRGKPDQQYSSKAVYTPQHSTPTQHSSRAEQHSRAEQQSSRDKSSHRHKQMSLDEM
jgi:hypothetical protein